MAVVSPSRSDAVTATVYEATSDTVRGAIARISPVGCIVAKSGFGLPAVDTVETE
jgi:hypothetical protein